MASVRKRVLLSPSWRERRRLLGEWIDDHHAEVAEGRALIWVGDRLLAQWLGFELAHRHGVLFPPPVRVAADVGREILLRAGRFAARCSGADVVACVSAALAAGGSEVARYAAFAERPATCRALADALAQLRAEEPDPERWVARWSDAVPHRVADLAALAALEQRVAELLESRCRALPSRLNREAANCLEPGALGPVSCLFGYDLVGLDRAERELLGAVLERSGVADVTMVLPGEPEPARDLFAAANPVLQTAVAAGLVVEHLPTPSDTLAAVLFQPAGGTAKPLPARLRVPTPQRGLIETFRRIRQALLGDPQLRPHDFVVVVPDLVSLADAARAMAERYGLDVAVAAAARRQLSGRAELVTAILGVVAEGFPRRAVIDLLSRPNRRSGADAIDVAALDAASRAAGIVDGPWAHWREELAQLRRTRALYDGPPEEAIDAATAAVDRLAEVFGAIEPATAAVHRRRLSDWLDWLRVDGSSGDDPLAILAALDLWPSDRPLPVTAYAWLATELLRSVEPADSPRPGCVLVTTPDRLVGAPPRQVYLLNAISGVLPRPPAGTIPFDPLDLERMGLAGYEGAGRHGWNRAALAFLDTLTAAERITVVDPAVDSQGELAIPSPFVEELEALGPWAADERVAAEERTPVPERALCLPEYVAGLVRRSARSESPEMNRPGRTGCLELARALEAARIEVARYGRQPPADRHDGKLQGTSAAEDIAMRYGVGLAFSPSRLEQYHLWPFDLFVRECLGIGEELEPTGALTAMVEGTLVHRALRRAFETDPAPADEATARKIGQVVADEVLADEWRCPGVSLRMWRRVRAQVAGWVAAVLMADGPSAWGKRDVSSRCPAYFEQRFGFDNDPSSWPLLRLESNDDLVLVRGVIDRLDRTDNGWLVIDYKRRASGKQDALDDRAPYQLALYALAVRQHTEEPRIAGWAYISYRRPQQSTAGRMKPEVIEATMVSTSEQVLADVARWRAGDFSVVPEPAAPDRHGATTTWQLYGAARAVERYAQEASDE